MQIHVQDEATTIARVVESLRSRFPKADRGDIDAYVEQVRARYADARVREYVPVMVEREVSEVLRNPAGGFPDTEALRDPAEGFPDTDGPKEMLVSEALRQPDSG